MSAFYVGEFKNRNNLETFVCYGRNCRVVISEKQEWMWGNIMFKILVVEDEKDLNKTVCSLW